MSKMYVALDFPTWQETKRFLDTYQLDGIPVKVGMELFYHEGLSVIENLQNRGHHIFLDLKLHDIPTTVKRAMANLAQLELDMVNVHALGGSEMIKQAKEGLSSSRHDTKLIAVTLVTSLDDEAIQRDLKLSGTIEENVKHLAHVAHASGADGVVCSVHEVEQIKHVCGNDFLTVTPGIRLDEAEAHDQKRIATPSFAKQTGSDYIVIGRSVTQADDPKAAYERAVKEWEHGTI